MTKTAEKTVVRSIHEKREQIATLREELEDLNDYLDLTETRVHDEGKPRLDHFGTMPSTTITRLAIPAVTFTVMAAVSP